MYNGTLKGFTLRFVGRGVATLFPCVGAELPGVVYSLEERDMETMHIFEGFPLTYDCRLKPIHTDLGVKLVWTYIHNDRHIAVPDENYMIRVLQGAEDSGIPDEHIWEAYEQSLKLEKSFLSF